ncbi:MAG: TonB-dependent receptor [Bacteroidota bacterium]
MKNILLILLLLMLTGGLELYAQNQEMAVEGSLQDSSAQPLAGATVILLQAADSVLKSFTLSDAKGDFRLPKAVPGKYILQITYVGYQDYSQPVELNSLRPALDMGTITLAQQSELLDEVLVKAAHIPIRMNNDTIEYNSAAYDTRPHAVVEDLLRKLPGVEVERDGTIRAQGERVQHVYVDGKEFFGDNPQMATQNLPADAVEKVQVYDKQSDMAEFTGIKDGQEEKTINLSLKEDKKNGHFGNGYAGYGTEDRYEGKALLNRFSRKMQLSTIGMLNNTNDPGFSLDDYINFMGGLQNMMSGGGGRVVLNSDELGLPLAAGAGNDGFMRIGAAGLNLNYDFSKRTQLSSSYFYNQIDKDISREISQQNLLGNAQFNSAENSDQDSKSSGHRLNLELEHKIDSFQSITLRSNLSYNDGQLNSRFGSETFNTEGLLENTGRRDYQSDGNTFDLKSSVNYRRRFRRKGRGLFGNFAFNFRDVDRMARLQAQNKFGLDTPKYFADSLRQSQEQFTQPVEYAVGLSYIEPIGGRKYLEFKYNRRHYSNESIKNFYDLSNGDTQEFNPVLSNHYQMTYRYDAGGLNFRLNRKKYNMTAGVALQRTFLNGQVFSEDRRIEQDFTYVLPSMAWNYNFNASRRLDFRYTTSIQEPSIEQLQPVVDNSNPLIIYQGNAELRPEYIHRVDLGLFSFDAFSSISVMTRLEGVYTQNSITTGRSIDSLFRQVLQPINVDDALRLSAYGSFSAPIKPLKSRFNLDANLIYNRSFLLINGVEDTNRRFQSSIDLSLENNNTKVLSVLGGAVLTRTRTRYAIDDRLNEVFLNQRYYLEASLNLGEKWSIESDINYTRFSNEAFGSSNRRLWIWNAALSRNFLDNRAQLSLMVRDILNQNLGIDRNSELNYLRETRVQSLARYATLRFTFALSGLGSRNGIGKAQVRRRTN